MKEIYQAGAAAHAAGIERGANPHHRPAARRAWDNGWVDANFNAEAPPLPLIVAGLLLCTLIFTLFK